MPDYSKMTEAELAAQIEAAIWESLNAKPDPEASLRQIRASVEASALAAVERGDLAECEVGNFRYSADRKTVEYDMRYREPPQILVTIPLK